MLLDLLPFLFAGIAAGVVAGFVPGVGVFVTLSLFYPWLMGYGGYEVFAFYLALASTTQYIGSITATVFSVPGETSSLPAVREGHALFLQGQGSYAISGAAIGSFLGSFLVLGITWSLMPYINNILYMYTTEVQALVIVAVLVLIITSAKSVFIGISMAVFGYLLGLVGCRHMDNFCFATFQDPQLEGGFPLLPVLLAVFVIPKLLTETQEYDASKLKQGNIQTENFFEHIKYFCKNLPTLFRGSFIGFFAGFTPGMSTTVSANLAYSAEKNIEKKRGTYKEGNYRSLVAAETANNAGAFACLLPLVIFGVPIIPSEALLFDLAAANGFNFGRDFSLEFFNLLAVLLIIVNTVALFIAWPFAKYVTYMHKLPARLFSYLIILLLMYILYVTGSNLFQVEFYFLTFFALLPIGLLLRNYDTLPLVFTFIVQSRIDVIGIRLFDLYGISPWLFDS